MKVTFFFVLFINKFIFVNNIEIYNHLMGQKKVACIFFETWTRTDEYTGSEGTKVDIVQGVNSTFRAVQA